MAFELRELQGNIFDNKFKETDKQPDKKGDLLLNGVPHEIAIWIKQGAKGEFWGFKISEKRIKQEDAPHSISQRAQATIRNPDDRITSGRMPPKQNIIPPDDMDDDIPFR